MKFFKDNGPAVGTSKNAVLALIAGIATIAACAVPLFISTEMLLIPILVWIFGIFNVRKGLNSEARTMAKIAMVLLIIGVVAIFALTVYSMLSVFLPAFGNISG